MTVILHSSKRTIQERPKILHLADIIIRRRTGEPDVVNDLRPKSFDCMRVLAEKVNTESESRGRLSDNHGGQLPG